MNPRTTWWLVGIALVMFTFIFAVERRGPGITSKPGEVTPLFSNFELNHVTQVQIDWTTNRSIRAERAGLIWRLPPSYPTQPGVVEQFLQKLATLHQLAVISPNEIAAQTNGRAAFGLEPPRAILTFQADTNRLTIHIGAKTIVGDQVYAQIAGRPEIHVTEGQLFSALPADAHAWRDRRLIYQASKIDRLAVTNVGRGFQLQLFPPDSTNQVWRLTQPLDVRADVRNFGQLIAQLESTQISRFVTDDPREDLDRFGLQNPEVQLLLSYGTNEVLHLHVGKSPTNDLAQVYAKRRAEPGIFLIPKEGLVQLAAQPYTFYRDHQFISMASARAITRIEGRTDKEELFVVERRSTNTWQIVSPFEARADTELINRFFGDLHRMEIIDFAADLADTNNLAPYGLNAPARQYWLKSAVTNAAGTTNALLARLDFSALGTNSLDRVSARRTDEPLFVYTVKYGDVTQLPRAAFELRDKQLWSFDETNVVSVAVTQGGKTNVLKRDAVHGWSPDAVLRAARVETLHRLSKVRVIGWTGRGEEQLKRFPLNRRIEIATVTGGQQKNYVIEFGGTAPSGNGYYAAATLDEGKPVLFVFPNELYHNYLVEYFGLGSEAALAP